MCEQYNGGGDQLPNNNSKVLSTLGKATSKLHCGSCSL